MKLHVQETTRWHSVAYDANPTPEKLREEILLGRGNGSDFTLLSAHISPRDQTVFKVASNGTDLVVAAGLFYTTVERLISSDAKVPDSLEILFDLRHDHLGWSQFIFPPEGNAEELSFDPYPEAHNSDYPLLHLKDYRTESETFRSATTKGWRCRWIYATFDASEVFRHSAVVGFNICRTRPELLEFSAWNFPSGNGFQDATGLGHLHRNAPAAVLHDAQAAFEPGCLRLHGRTDCGDITSMKVRAPSGEEHRLEAVTADGQWSAVADLPQLEHGRYSIVVDGNVEPREMHIDAAPPAARKSFTLSATYDTPMSLMPNCYTPERLRSEFSLLKEFGISKMHWIQNPDDWRSFWEYDRWGDNYAKTVEHCGDLLKCATEQAHHNGQQLYALYKVFDIGMNVWWFNEKTPSTVLEMEGLYAPTVPEIAAHPEWTLQSNTAWRRVSAFPITSIRLFSDEPIPAITADLVRLLVSADNRSYDGYTGPFSISQGVQERPNYRWTPAGKVPIEGTTPNWYIEISGLNINEAFAAVQIDSDITLAHRGFMVAEATDANGQEAPLTVATSGHRDFRDKGYFFFKEWQDWVNSTEAILQRRKWSAKDFGMTFQEAPNMPTILEPSYEGTRNLWLGRLQSFLEAGVDGIDIRILCHHNGPMAYLKYAFAPAVCETFRGMYGRDPQTTHEDYQRIRHIRGDFFTQFLRDAKKLAAARGAKLAAHLEYGIEVPTHYNTRMQLFLDYKTWINEGIIDEIQLKYWTAHSPFVHEQILPIARRQGIPVHIISRCFDNGFDHQGILTTEELIASAYRAGFDGFNLYEVDNLIELNAAGVPMAKGFTAPALRRAKQELQRLMSH